MSEVEWYRWHGASHAHCPNGCEKPQPVLVDGRMLCSKCGYYDKRTVDMLPCTPETCDEAPDAD